MHEINNLIHNADIKFRIITKSVITGSHNYVLIPLRVALTIENSYKLMYLRFHSIEHINFECDTKIMKPRLFVNPKQF